MHERQRWTQREGRVCQRWMASAREGGNRACCESDEERVGTREVLAWMFYIVQWWSVAYPKQVHTTYSILFAFISSKSKTMIIQPDPWLILMVQELTLTLKVR